MVTYKQTWRFNDDIAKWLRLFTGDILPKEILSKKELQNIKEDYFLIKFL